MGELRKPAGIAPNAHVFDRTQQVERHGEGLAAVMPQPDQADAEPLHRAFVAAGLDVSADPKRVVEQVEHAGDDVAGKGLGPGQ